MLNDILSILNEISSFLTSNKNVIEAIQSLLTSIAILCGAYWSYNLFIKRRQKYPRAGISHQIIHKSINPHKTLLHTSVTIHNKGDVLLSVVSLKTSVHPMIPASEEILRLIDEGYDPVYKDDTEILWKTLYVRSDSWNNGEFEIEPNESDEIHYDFIIDSTIQTVQVYSHFTNVSKRSFLKSLIRRERKIGWGITTIYDLTPYNNSTDTAEGLMSSDKGNPKTTEPSNERQREPKETQPAQPVKPRPRPTDGMSKAKAQRSAKKIRDPENELKRIGDTNNQNNDRSSGNKSK